jgi:hypothetical protein
MLCVGATIKLALTMLLRGAADQYGKLGTATHAPTADLSRQSHAH